MQRFDFVVVGAGIMGLSMAREILRAHPNSKIVVLDKEAYVGKHASGKNSGVLHMGLYYGPGSLKAKLCQGGARKMAEYCLENRLPYERCGKVVLPLSESDDRVLDEIQRRADQNGATVRMIGAQELREIEPLAHSCTGRALHSPNTSIVDSVAILEHLSKELGRSGVELRLGEKLEGVSPAKAEIVTSKQRFSFGHLVNTAGLQADLLAKEFEVGRSLTILPFKGIYYKIKTDPAFVFRGLVYPVPDMNVPFLGIHFTKLVNGDVTIGPTALPAFGRENYHGMEDVTPKSFLQIGLNLMGQYVRNHQGFRRFAHNEIKHLAKSAIVKEGQLMVPTLKKSQIMSHPKVGLRAQLFDEAKQELVMDFLVEKGPRSTHILNAVSPAFTSSFAFAEHLVSQGL